MFKLLVSGLILSLAGVAALADTISPEVQRLLPLKVGAFSQLGAIKPADALSKQGLSNGNVPGLQTGNATSGQVQYRSLKGDQFLVELMQLPQDGDAYSLLTILAGAIRDSSQANLAIDNQVGTASVVGPGTLLFYKGRVFVRVTTPDPDRSRALEFGRLLADQFDNGEGEIPVLVKHLPDWEEAVKRAIYFSGFKSLQSIAPDQPVLAVLDSAGDGDAVVATYGDAKLAIIEFNTPQLAADNDRTILAKLQELRSQNQPMPSAYRRVGNYSVFVFDAASETLANAMIDKVQYEQVVQWLGDNPYWFKEAQRRYTETTLGVLVAVVKASGLTLVLCFGLGGLIGAIMFIRRRARQTTAEAFSDAGGMLRLNLDEMTPQTDPARLLTDRN